MNRHSGIMFKKQPGRCNKLLANGSRCRNAAGCRIAHSRQVQTAAVQYGVVVAQAAAERYMGRRRKGTAQ